MENSTKLQRGGKTSGLTRLDNCLSNSDIDFPLLSSQFKDLNLQLHAGINVTNPYTFSIQGNTSFSAQLESAIPDKTTTLDSSNTYGENLSLSVVIPSGVRVILVRATADVFIHHTGEQYSVDVTIGSTTKKYITANGVASIYVKVTQGKQYNIYARAYADDENEHPNISLAIYYSKTINNTTPQIEDL